MLFNSTVFLIFIVVVFYSYWFIFKNKKVQNFFILFSSYVFYGWWDWRFLFLIFGSSLLDFLVAKKISENGKHKKKYLISSLVFNLGTLFVFKYFNFFHDSLVDSCAALGFEISSITLRIILPVGISFYTFQTLSYSIDVYLNKIKASDNFVSFATYVSFFPQLVAGPIERASDLLPQFSKKRVFDYAKSTDALKLILWGFLKKTLIADNCAPYVDLIFDNPEQYGGITLFLGAVLFAFQIYCDFSGYSDIAIGIARLFGFELKYNFKTPYFSRNFGEFWRRWHISLSNWFRDYLYIPLGGSKGNFFNKTRNVFIIFMVSGLWHGANWTFIFWGALNALYFIPSLVLGTNRKYKEENSEKESFKSNLVNSAKNSFHILSTFSLTCLAWVFFRADNLEKALNSII